MSRILSEDEVDALLRGVRAGAVSAGARAKASGELAVRSIAGSVLGKDSMLSWNWAPCPLKGA